MSTHNIGFYEEIRKIITYHQISSNTHLISSAGFLHAYIVSVAGIESLLVANSHEKNCTCISYLFSLRILFHIFS